MAESVICLGCKVNQAESAWLGEQMAGLAGPALLLTCAVTANASRQSRQMARRLLKSRRQVLVSGCDAQLAPQTYHDLGAMVLPRACLGSLSLSQGWPVWQPGRAMPAPHQGLWVNGWRKPDARHTRGQLKVQDGCDANCAYCIVPAARGLPRSLPLARAVDLFVKLGNSGAREVVLSGIHLGRYQDEGQDLSCLLRALLAAHPGPRIRLSSLEITELTDELLDLMACQARVCPHLHLPLQAGSDALLQAMGRPYTISQYAGQVERALNTLPGVCLGADVLAGLPGENDLSHRAALDLLKKLPLAYLHVFPYSPRPGTPAAAMPGRPDSRSVRQRAGELRRLGQEKWIAFLKKQLGRKLEVLTESQGLGRAENYCPVRLPEEIPAGKMLSMKIKSLLSDPKYCLGGELI